MALKPLKDFFGKIFRKEPSAKSYSAEQEGLIYNNNDSEMRVQISGADRELVNDTQAQTLTNKSIDADNNTITNIDDGEIKTGAAINATKIHDGSVDNTEFGHLNGVTSNIQTQIDSKADDADLTNHIADTTTHGTTGNIVGTSDTQTLTNKTIDADSNTINNIDNGEIKAGAAIDATKIHDGTVDNTEFGHLNGVSSNIQTQLNAKATSTDLSNHISDTTTHGTTGDIVGTSDSQTLTNKTIDGNNNTISNLEHGAEVDNPSSGVHGVTGNVVGTTDTQVLTNKDIDGGTAANNRRITVPKDTNTNLTALTRKEGTIVYDTTNSVPLYDDGTSLQSFASAGSVSFASYLGNVGLDVSLAAGAATIALKQSDGSTDATVLNPASLGFRSTTLTSGAYNIRNVTSSLSVVISSGSTLGTVNGSTNKIYVYAIDNAGTVELAVSRVPYWDESQLISTTAEGGAGGADTNYVIYSTTARSNVPFRMIGYFESTQVTAGTWSTSPTTVFAGSIEMIQKERIVMTAVRSGNQNANNNTYTTVIWNSKESDPFNILNSSNGDIVIPCDGLWSFTVDLRWDGNTSGTREIVFDISGTRNGWNYGTPTNPFTQTFYRTYDLTQGTSINIDVWQDSGGTRTIQGGVTGDGPVTRIVVHKLD